MDEQSIFNQALAIESVDERATFLHSACENNPDLRTRIELLLRLQEDAGSFLEKSPEELVALSETLVDESGNDSDDRWKESLEPSDDPQSLGKLGSYEIAELIGRGGMGVVLRAFDPKLKRTVAIKMLAPEFAAQPMSVRRFHREAQAAAAVSHDHVVTIHDIDQTAQPPRIVMECIDGQSLQQKIDNDGALSVKAILRIGMQTSAGLSAAHKQGLIHRDIKPSNILLENGIERVKLTDFGLARAVDDIGVTQTGQITGTPQYMSPEQAQGHSIDHRTDLFSLGCVLYAMCTGRAAFRADSAVAVMHRVVHDTPKPIREANEEIPEWLCEIVDKLLEKDPKDRFESSREVEELLGQHLAHLQQPHSITRPGSVGRTQPQVERETEHDLVSAAWTFLGIGLGSLAWFVLALLAMDNDWFRTWEESLQLLCQVSGFLSLPIGLLAMNAHFAVQRRTSYHWVRSAARLALTPWNPFLLLALPKILRLNQTLKQPEIQAAFGESPPQGSPADENKVREWVSRVPILIWISVWFLMFVYVIALCSSSGWIERTLAEQVGILLFAIALGFALLGGASSIVSRIVHRHDPARRLGNPTRLVNTVGLLFLITGLFLNTWAAHPHIRLMGMFGLISETPGGSIEFQLTDPSLVVELEGLHGTQRLQESNANHLHSYLAPGLYKWTARRAGKLVDAGEIELVPGEFLRIKLPREKHRSPVLETSPFFDAFIDYAWNPRHLDAIDMREMMIEPAEPFDRSQSPVQPKSASGTTSDGTPFTNWEITWSVSGSGGSIKSMLDAKLGEIEELVHEHGATISRSKSRRGLHGETAEVSANYITKQSQGTILLRLDGYTPSRSGGLGDTPLQTCTLRFEIREEMRSPDLGLLTSDSGERGVDGDSVTSAELLTSADYEWTEPENLGPLVNSSDMENSPTLSSDGLTLIFSSKEWIGGRTNSKLLQSTRKTTDSRWEKPELLGAEINNTGSERDACLSADSLTLFFTSERDGGLGAADIWMCERGGVSDTWSTPKNLGADVNSRDYDTMPTISADGLTLIFASDREVDEQSRGKSDLWMCTRESKTQPWSKAINLGPNINSRGREFFPMLSADGLSLLYTSDFPPGEGFHLCVATRVDPSSPWSKPINIDRRFDPKSYDKKSPYFFQRDRTLFYATSRADGEGDSDLWISKLVRKQPRDNEPKEVAEEFSEQQWKELLSQASSIPLDEYNTLAGDIKGPNTTAVRGESLSLVLLNLDPFAEQQNNEHVIRDFWYLTERLPKPQELAKAMSISKSKGYVSLIQPEYVTNFEIAETKGTTRGHIGFSVPKLYSGRVEFTAERTDGTWQIVEFVLPNYGITIRRDESDQWRRIVASMQKEDAETDWTLSIDKDEQITIQSERVDEKDLDEKLHALSEQAGMNRVLIQAHPEVQHQTVVEMLDRLQKQGFAEIRLQVLEAEPAPLVAPIPIREASESGR